MKVDRVECMRRCEPNYRTVFASARVRSSFCALPPSWPRRCPPSWCIFFFCGLCWFFLSICARVIPWVLVKQKGEQKDYYANERNYIHWLHMAVTLGLSPSLVLLSTLAPRYMRAHALHDSKICWT
jgi:hypothetical protein